jgi:hypothetical protein
MSRRWVALALAVCLVAGLAAVPSAGLRDGRVAQEGTVVGRPNFLLAVPNDTVSPGETATLSAVLVNDARVVRGGAPREEARVTTAYNVSVRPRTERFPDRLADELAFRTGRVPVGTVPSGVSDPIEFRVAVGRLPPGTYRVPFEVTYSYTALVEPNRTAALRTRTEVVNASLVVRPAPRLRITTPEEQSLSPGESESVTLAVTNAGTETASEVGLTLSVDNGSVYFGTRLDRRARVGFYVPALEPGETETVAVRMGADDATAPGTYLVSGEATYRDSLGSVHETAWLATGIPVDGANGGGTASALDYSSVPSRTITAIPVSKSVIASAESSARPTARIEPSSWTIATSSPGRSSGPTAATNFAKTFFPSRTNGSLSSPTTTRPAGASSAAATRRPPSSPRVNRPSVP